MVRSGSNGKKRRERESRIYEAADKLFCEVGYHGVSMRDVALRAGVNKALVFYYFKSKAELFERVLERYYEAQTEAFSQAFEGQGTLRERFHRVIDAYMDFMSKNQRYARLVQQQVADADTHDLIQRNLAPLFTWLTEVLSEVAPEKGPLSARHFFVTFSGMVINYFTYASVLDGLWGAEPMSEVAFEERRQHIHWMVDIILQGLTQEKTSAES